MYSVKEIKEGLENKEFSSVELVNEYFKKIKKEDIKIKSFITLNEEKALEEAKNIDRKILDRKPLKKLEGVPIGLKDNIITKDLKTTCSSKILKDYLPPYDATATKCIKNKGEIILGKLNMDEFAMGSANENSAFFDTKNPWDLERVPGGSSGASAAAVSSGFVPVSYGSDTGGSVRIPASYCGVVGLKPSYGAVSRYGLIPLAPSLDHIGPLAKSVEDCVYGFQAVKGYDEKDATSVKTKNIDYFKEIRKGINGLKLGIPKEYFGNNVKEEIKKNIYRNIIILEKMGVETEEFSLDIINKGLSAYYIISSAEASSNLGRYDGIIFGSKTKSYENFKDLVTKTRTEGFGFEVKRRIIIGNCVLAAGYYQSYYKKAMAYKKKVEKIFVKTFEKYDAIVTPTVPFLPFKLGKKNNNPMEKYSSDAFTIGANLAGIPAISVPSGFSEGGLPIGMQFMSDKFKEDILFRLAYSLEKELDLNLNTWEEKNDRI